LNSIAESHIGQRRVNEDYFLIDEALGLYIVADGVGGLEKGEIASRIACDTISSGIKSGLTLSDAVYLAHRTIIGEIKQDLHKQGMATTIVAVLFNENAYEVIWVGDSRAYLWDKNLKQITKDDSYVELLLENGHIGIEELESHPDRNIISQALGIERKQISLNKNSGTLVKGQIMLLCTDGLYSITNQIDIIDSIKQLDNIEDITGTLVKTAVDKDGKDNITLMLIETNANTILNETIVNPYVYREFDINTGKLIDFSLYDDFAANETATETKGSEEIESDPELIDQTTYRNMTEDDQNLLDSAAHSVPNKNKKSIIPVLMVTVLALVAYIVLRN
jgi:protein phosphatase